MSIVATVLIAIASAVIAFIIGLCVGVGAGSPNVTLSDTAANPVVIFNAKPPQPIPAVTSKVVLPKRISKAEYNKLVDACLKDAVAKAVNVWGYYLDKSDQQSFVDIVYADWHGKLVDKLAYDKYNSDLQRLDIVGYQTKSGKIVFDAAWKPK